MITHSFYFQMRYMSKNKKAYLKLLDLMIQTTSRENQPIIIVVTKVQET